jgi:hypothetical protein
LSLEFVLKLNNLGEKSLDLRLDLEGNARQLNSVVVTQSIFVDVLYEVLAVFEAGANLIW